MPDYEVIVIREITQSTRVKVTAANGREAEQRAREIQVPDQDWLSSEPYVRTLAPIRLDDEDKP